MLTIAISTTADRFTGMELPPERAGVRYLIIVQGGCPILARCDLCLVCLDNWGLSNSRNAALRLADSEFLLFSDDDTELELDGICALRDTMLANPDLDFAAGRRRQRMSGVRVRPALLGWWNSGGICAPELMLRPSRFRAVGVQFDTNFGLGAAFGLGEEYVFVTDAMKAGLRGVRYPIITGSHAAASTGDDWTDPALMRARRAVLQRVFGWSSGVIWVAYVLRHRRAIRSLRRSIRYAFGLRPV